MIDKRTYLPVYSCIRLGKLVCFLTIPVCAEVVEVINTLGSESSGSNTSENCALCGYILPPYFAIVHNESDRRVNLTDA